MFMTALIPPPIHSTWDATAKRIDSKLANTDRVDMKDWLVADGIPADQIDITNTDSLLNLWVKNYDPTKNIPGMTNAKRNYYVTLDASLKGILSTQGLSIADTNPRQPAPWNRRVPSRNPIT